MCGATVSVEPTLKSEFSIFQYSSPVLGVQRDDMAVELRLDDQRGRLAVAGPVGETAIDDVAAGDGARRGVLLGLMLPQMRVGIVEVERERLLGKDV